MKDSKWIRFLQKHGRKIIAMILAVAILGSLTNLGVFSALFRQAQQTEPETTEPATTEPPTTEPETTAEVVPQESLTPEQELEQTADYLTDAIAKAPEDAKLYAQRAAVYYNLGNTEAAVADYTTALSLKEDPETRYLRAVVYTSSGNSQAAYDDLSAALEADPDNKDYLSLMADTCNALQKYRQSLQCLEALLAEDPDNCVLHTLAGDACVYLGEFQKSLPHYEKAISCYSEKAQSDGISKASLYSAYGNGLKTLNRFAEAAVAYDQSLRLEKNKELYFQRGFCLLQSENYEDATQDFTKCIELGYESVLSHFQRGLCHYARGSHSEAIADFRIYEEAFPNKADTWLYMGLCHQSVKEYEAAVSYYQKCIGAEISTGICYYNIGNCYYNQEQYAEAVKNYTCAIDLGSYLYEALLNRGVSYVHLNKYNEAKADLKRVIDECSDSSLVESAKKSYEPIKNITIITRG